MRSAFLMPAVEEAVKLASPEAPLPPDLGGGNHASCRQGVQRPPLDPEISRGFVEVHDLASGGSTHGLRPFPPLESPPRSVPSVPGTAIAGEGSSRVSAIPSPPEGIF